MPSNHAINLRTTSGAKMEDVRFSFGVTSSKVRDRPIREGQGFSIELPAVLDLLETVAAGEEQAADARELLLNVVDTLYDSAGCYDYETVEDKLAWCVRDGGCQTCEEQRSSFAHHLETMAERWRRWTLPDEFPFATGSSMGLHTVKCGVVRRDMPDGFTAHKPDDVAPLRAFAHAYDDFGLPVDESEQLPAHVPFQPMSGEEARAWMTENTGPKGGRYYKRCRMCAPTP
ncbi:hypothetical protein [Nocardiopsis valliformis]|uniref:hypothetical protein n=1 Tax=Nocardiopsis valliformis TaxID=239974 RepID=UPI0003468D0E|nr:hypothetical protein [Nocardiopsis valliformis]